MMVTLLYLSPVLYLLLEVHAKHSAVLSGDKYKSGDNTDVGAAIEFLERYNKLANRNSHAKALAGFTYQTNITDHNKKIMLKQEKRSAEFKHRTWKEATSYAWKDLKDKHESAYRAFKKLAVLDTSVLRPKKLKELQETIADMETSLSTATVCPYKNKDKNCSLSLEPDLTGIISTSSDYDEMAYYWAVWRDLTGKKVKDKFIRLVELKNEAAKLDGYADAGDMLRDGYERDTFADEVEDLLQSVKPFYEQLHAYVRRKLMGKYKDRIKPDGPIPAHLLGNMYAQKWNSIEKLLDPYPETGNASATETMEKKKMKVLDMVKVAEEFYVSLGLIAMPDPFWNNSVFEKPKDRKVVCHASATDLYLHKDVRIKMCAKVTQDHLITIHHEMGHIQYYLQYAHQPNVFRDGANHGFHEAVGDTLALSVSTPKHMHKIGLLKDLHNDREHDIKFLLWVALQKLTMLPFAYLIDFYRWRIYDGKIQADQLNVKWWQLRLKHQGLCPPVTRKKADFDAGSKHHVATDVPYIRYFVAVVLQFQFHKALCNASGHKGPLHKCDIYKSKEAGTLFSKMLSLGHSVPAEEAMKVITQGETDKMDIGAFLEYFAPLRKWLEEQNKDEYIGWKSDDPLQCP